MNTKTRMVTKEGIRRALRQRSGEPLSAQEIVQAMGLPRRQSHLHEVHLQAHEMARIGRCQIFRDRVGPRQVVVLYAVPREAPWVLPLEDFSKWVRGFCLGVMAVIWGTFG